MLVEDNETDILLAKRLIELHEIALNIIIAKHGIDALKKLSEYFELNKALPDVLLIDLQMPLMNGFELIERIKTLPFYSSTTKIIAISASMDDDNDKERLRLLGIPNFLLKPFEIPIFQELL
jgi:chemosensory pili system protein ChpA (sensor histidine kinase/response regulator)